MPVVRTLPWNNAVRLAGRALASGATRTSVAAIRWDCAPGCTRPHEVWYVSREWSDRPPKWPARSVQVLIEHPCRACEACRKRKRSEWTRRAIQEYRRSYRSWLVTLTLRPDAVAALALRGRKSLPRGTEFQRVAREMSREATKWLKRVREATGARIRYMLVVEEMPGGAPHMHLVVHERSHPIGERALRRAWRLGFAHAKLIRDEVGATYAAKYLSKTMLARVRASIGYGAESAERRPPP